jgi:hypothetical protein
MNILLYFLILHSKCSKINDRFKYYNIFLEYIIHICNPHTEPHMHPHAAYALCSDQPYIY